jgi:hypothetical protein
MYVCYRRDSRRAAIDEVARGVPDKAHTGILDNGEPGSDKRVCSF